MAGELSPFAHGIPVVSSATERNALFPTPFTNQRVQNLQTRAIERYTGVAWVPDLSNVVNVRAHGVKGDGVTDDTAAINAVLAAAIDGDALFFPEGVYKITGQLTLDGRTRVRLYGDGFGSCFAASAPSFDMLVVNDTCTYITVDHLRFLGASVALEGVAAIRCKAPNSTVHHCEVSNVNGAILFSAGTYFSGWEGCSAHDNYVHNIIGATSGNGYGVYTDCPLTVVAGNRFVDVGRHDVYVSGNATKGADGTAVTGNVSKGNGVQSIGTNAPANQPPLVAVSIIGNTILDPLGFGIGLSINNHGCIIANNAIDGQTNTAAFPPIYIEGGATLPTPLASEIPLYNVISGNAITRNLHDEAIRLLNTSYCQVVGNNVSAAVRGIMVTSTGTPYQFPTGNVVDQNIAVPGIVPVQIDASCVDTVVGTNYGTVASSIGNNRNVITVTSNAVTTVTVPDTADPITIKFAQTGTQTITDFPGGRDGARLTCYFQNSGVVTITNAHCFFVGGASSFTSTQNDTISFVKIGSNWFELGRVVI